MTESFTEKQNRTIKFYKKLTLICIFLIQKENGRVICYLVFSAH